MKIIFLIFMVALGQAADTPQIPLQIPESFRPYGNLIEALCMTEGLTFADAVRMVEPFADELGAIQEDPQTPQLQFLLTQNATFEAAATRLKTLLDMDPKNKCVEQAWFLIWSITRKYQSPFLQRDFTILNSCTDISLFFATTPSPRTDLFPLHIHKLLFLMYISEFLAKISYIVNHTTGFFKDDDNEKEFLSVFDNYLKKTTMPCGNKLVEHALWILREHVVYVGEKKEEEFT